MRRTFFLRLLEEPTQLVPAALANILSFKTVGAGSGWLRLVEKCNRKATSPTQVVKKSVIEMLPHISCSCRFKDFLMSHAGALVFSHALLRAYSGV